ncbi:transporter substrate-binding domain-containing protein [Alsobacter sp. R-9]
MRFAPALRCAIAVFVLGAAMGAGAQERGPLRIATEGAYPPFNYTDAAGQLQGFEIDLARALCDRMAATCTFTTEDWERLIPGLRHGHFDAIVASLEITPERQQRIAFSKPYYRTPAVFMGRKGDAVPGTDPATLRTLRVGAMAGTPYANWLLQKVGPEGQVRLYANQDEASLDLALGRIDLVLGDKIALQEWLKRGKEADCCVFVADAPADPAVFGLGYGIGVRKDDTSLRQHLDAALDAIMADGTYDAIRARYFPFDVR